MSERAALITGLGFFAAIILIIAATRSWDLHDRSAIERAADACTVACRHGGVASVSATECRCKEDE